MIDNNEACLWHLEVGIQNECRGSWPQGHTASPALLSGSSWRDWGPTVQLPLV